MFSDEVREKILSKEELQKLDLVTLSLVIHAIEEVLEEVEDDKQSLSDNTYDELWICTAIWNISIQSYGKYTEIPAAGANVTDTNAGNITTECYGENC